MADDQRCEFNNRIVHFDLKGAPLKVSYFEKIFPFLRTWGATGILMEYEDTFPYQGDLSILAAPHAYSIADIECILKLATDNKLSVIPLVQSFGHLEFVLKNECFKCLREIDAYPMALCPSNSDAVQLVYQMIDQVIHLHPNIQYFHIGCDEVYHLAMCHRCKQRMSNESLGREHIFFAHVKNIANYMKKNYPALSCIVWDDMFRFSELPVILNCDIGGLVEPMVWFYAPKFLLPPDLWDKLSSVFSHVWIASAYKGATGPRATITNISFHLDNTHNWMRIVQTMAHKFKSVKGIVLTGWQRYDHYAVLCELFPHSLPCLGLCLRLLQGSLTPVDSDCVAKDLGFTAPIPVNPFAIQGVPVCCFPGCEIYCLMIKFVHTESSINEFFSLDGLIVWMNDYNVERGFINPVHVEPLLARGVSLLALLRSIDENVDKTFEDVFVDSVSVEWKAVFVKPLFRKLEEFVSKAEKIMKITSSVNVKGL